jgi:DnaK suppressor protein
MKAKPGKVTVSSKVKKAAAKTASSAKAKAKPASKPAAKAKTSPKPAAGKAAVKPSKPAAGKKPASKSAPKAKPASKVATKTKPVKPAAKAAKPVTKALDKAKSASGAPKSKQPSAPAKPGAKTAGRPQAVTKPASSTAAAPAKPATIPVSTPAAKAPRPSSRLAQLTVPSMLQSVASTAAKASYTQIMSSPPIAPPIPATIKKDLKLANNWKSKSPAELTDAELMAMPDSEYMNETQLAAFRHKLMALKQDILSNAGETTEHLREDTVVVPDPADRATIEEEHALELRTRDRERKLLKKIEQSIIRIDAGDYGYCDETGEPIGVGRLLARPTATLSLEAQQRRELKQKMFGD